MSSTKNPGNAARPRALLRIGEVARRVGISSSALRAWEAASLIRPRRTASRYRMYTEQDVRLLKRAYFLRRVRGLNPPAIVHLLRRQGVVSPAHAGASRVPGRRFRSLRRERRQSLAQVARATGVSIGFLSAIERGQMTASVSTLRRLARYFKTNILSLFGASEDNPRLVRPDRRKVLETSPGVRMELLAWGNTAMEPHLFRVKPGGGSGESYTHEGEEFLFVLRGRLEIFLDEKERYILRPGDSFYFESTTPHRWRNAGRSETWLLWINTPPTF